MNTLFKPLWNVQVGAEVLVRMSDDSVLRYVVTEVRPNVACPDPDADPALNPLNPPLALQIHDDCTEGAFWTAGTDHERLTCSACHSQWAPQCFGCHMDYDENGEQWDHVEQKLTAGRWSDRRWDVRNTLPALGVNAAGRIEAFVPGMIMTLAHPSWDDEKFVRMFAPLSPHTTGKARSCESCHRSSRALGLGAGDLAGGGHDFSFTPLHDLLQDALPSDAWTSADSSLGGATPVPGQRTDPGHQSAAQRSETVLSAGAGMVRPH